MEHENKPVDIELVREAWEKALPHEPTLEYAHVKHPFEVFEGGRLFRPWTYWLSEDDRALIRRCVPGIDLANRQKVVKELRRLMPLGRLSPAEVSKLTWQEIMDYLKANDAAQPKATHSSDFTQVTWYGQTFSFAPGNQARAVGVLWEEWERTGHGLHQETIAYKLDPELDPATDDFRIDKLFRDNPALGTMIRKVGKGMYKLVPPERNNANSGDFPQMPG